tara:strand:+ start:166 stop:333 length:168 start_codon:yes stop_codon:yes gene_type:complete
MATLVKLMKKMRKRPLRGSKKFLSSPSSSKVKVLSLCPTTRRCIPNTARSWMSGI